MPSIRHREVNRYHARRRVRVEQKSWSRTAAKLSDRQFHRYFRLSKAYFQHLCDQIEDIIGPSTFKSELHLNKLMKVHIIPNGARNIIAAHESSTGGMISGQVKLALTLRVLGGGSYMDMAWIFEIRFNHAHKIFKEVINWLTHDLFYPISGVEYCQDDARMNEVAMQFSNASNGVINGCIGALDGWVVKILKPLPRDNVFNALGKGYFGINVQAIVDKKKRILFRCIMSRGAEHDSTAFKNSSLYTWLIGNWQALARKGYYFIGDSEYSLKSFVLTPYGNAVHGTPEDDFNFFHSSCRISVECCFGEVDLLWGIFGGSLIIHLSSIVKLLMHACACTILLLSIEMRSHFLLFLMMTADDSMQ